MRIGRFVLCLRFVLNHINVGQVIWVKHRPHPLVLSPNYISLMTDTKSSSRSPGVTKLSVSNGGDEVVLGCELLAASDGGFLNECRQR